MELYKQITSHIMTTFHDPLQSYSSDVQHIVCASTRSMLSLR